MKHIIIINPTAGINNEIEKLESKINEAFKEYDFVIYHTKGPKDATKFVKNYLENNKETVRFYSCGGDGTLNEIVNGVIGYDNAQVACYPIGSGNDYVKYFGKVEDFLDFKQLIEGETVLSDIIKFNDRYVVNIFNVGLDANVAVLQKKYKKIPLVSGKAAYNLGVVGAVLRKINHRYNITLDGEKLYEGKIALCAVCNAICYGGGYYCAPRAKINDGLLDVCAVKKIGRLALTKLIKDYKAGKHLDNPKFAPYILYKQGKKVEIELEKPLYYSIDGETEKAKKLSLEIIKDAFRFVVPKIKPVL